MRLPVALAYRCPGNWASLFVLGGTYQSPPVLSGFVVAFGLVVGVLLLGATGVVGLAGVAGCWVLALASASAWACACACMLCLMVMESLTAFIALVMACSLRSVMALLGELRHSDLSPSVYL